MNPTQRDNERDALVALPEDVPVVMPELPHELRLTTPQQFKAIGDPVRVQIMHDIELHPATAKQIADSMGATPGMIAHHLHVLEAAGLVQVVARRTVRGTVAKYYARTARVFILSMPQQEGEEEAFVEYYNTATAARDELIEAIRLDGVDSLLHMSLPHARLATERASYYYTRLIDLIDEFLQEPPDPEGEVHTLFTAFFVAPSPKQGLAVDEKLMPNQGTPEPQLPDGAAGT